MFRRKPAQPAPVDRWLVIGLGNPGGEYERSRHNVGFLVVDELARRHGGRVTDRAAKSLTGRVRSGAHELVVAKPQTWMNLSGQAAKALRTKYDVPLERVLVVHDELDLPFGRLRIRTGGSSAGNRWLDWAITCGARSQTTSGLGCPSWWGGLRTRSNTPSSMASSAR